MKLSKFPLAVAGALALSSGTMADGQYARSLKLQVYSVMLSTSALCSNPCTAFSSTSPTEVDFLSAPTLGSGNPPDATYNCVIIKIIKMSNIIKFAPSSTSRACAPPAPSASLTSAGPTIAPHPGSRFEHADGLHRH